MRAVLIVAAASLAAIALPAASADAQSFAADRSLTTSHGVSIHGGLGHRDGDRRRHRRSPNVIVVGDGGWNDAWALYNNRGWESGSYNDWWHDRPDRAYPRWMQTNQNCERMWWGGGAWRC